MPPVEHERGLRKQRSSQLEQTEDDNASKAVSRWTAAFTAVKVGNTFAEAGRKSSQEDTDHTFTFANRNHWKAFQQTLEQIADTGEGEGEMESETDAALKSFDTVVDKVKRAMKEKVQNPGEEAFLEDTFVSNQLKDCVFVGHMATDMDSIAGAIGAAALFGGIAAKSESELNGEITHVLQKVADLPEPDLYDDIPGCSKPDANGNFKKICLVDHNEEKQMVPSLREDPNRRKRIVGLIDHHAMASSFCTDTPLLIDLRPWGSMSSIVAHMYVRNNRFMTPNVARVLMCAILSDTLNLQSVTTTDADRFAVALLAKVGKVPDPDEVARLMFRAKTSWIVNLGPYAMCRGDQKDFCVNGWKFGIAVLEVTVVDQVLAIADKLILELRALKVEKGDVKNLTTGEVTHDHTKELDFAFLFVVNVVKQCSVMLVCGGREHALAVKAFEGAPYQSAKAGMKNPGKTITAEQTLCDVGPLVSRKAQFVPAFSRVLNEGFTCHKPPLSSAEYDISKESLNDMELRKVLAEGGAAVQLDADQIFERDDTMLGKAVYNDPSWTSTRVGLNTNTRTSTSTVDATGPAAEKCTAEKKCVIQ